MAWSTRDVLEHRSDQAVLLGMAILLPKYSGNRHALLIQHDEGLPREGRSPSVASFLKAVGVIGRSEMPAAAFIGAGV